MKQKVDTSELQMGMYVSELDRPWTSTNFLFQGFEISDEATLQELKDTCEYVYIDTEKAGDTVDKGKTTQPRTIEYDTVTELSVDNMPDLQYVLEGPPTKKRWSPETSTLEEEVPKARRIESETRTVLYNTLEDVRLGRTIDSEATKAVIADMVESIIRNPDAMGVLSQLKDADEYTALHSVRVCILALTFGRHLDMTREELNLLGVGALLHDVGKMRVPVEILNKKGRLTEEEFEIMKSHVPLGVEVLQRSPGIPRASIEVAANHHERYAGGGYANGQKGDSIGVFGMIGGVVDCYDAITSDRSYHKGMTAYDALSKMYQWRNTAFHPGLIEQFIQCMGVYPIGSIVELSTGAIGVVATVNRERRLKPRVALILNSDKEPYDAVKVVDLMREATRNPNGAPEIKKVIPAGEYGIMPSDYLPLIGTEIVSHGT
jgi:putative nucleotidyltransferase with HDIG domain